MPQPTHVLSKLSPPIQATHQTQSTPQICGFSHIPPTQPLHGVLQTPLLHQSIPQMQVNQPIYGMDQESTSQPNVWMMHNPSGKPFQSIGKIPVGQSTILQMTYQGQ